jgi:hypothetical protein
MQIYREIAEIETEELVVHVPEEFRHKKVEIIITSLNEKEEKVQNQNKESRFAKTN